MQFKRTTFLTTGFLFLFTACMPSGGFSSPLDSSPFFNNKQLTNQPLSKPAMQHQTKMRNLQNQFPGVVFYKGDSSLKRVALTFDDGPDNYYTPKILEILHQKHVKATFFVVGMTAKRHPSVLKRIVKEGHSLGNHGWGHARIPKLTDDRIVQELTKAEDTIESITGLRPDIYRPPYGDLTAANVGLLHQLGFRVVDWSVDTEDWRGLSDQQILSNVHKQVSPGAIILLHSLSRRGKLDGALKALPQMIDQLQAEGYEFVTVQTLLEKQSLPIPTLPDMP
ncbi:polysaccharide deacetylase family protein [Effusibacillus dendaii]|uniref:NodB homology domain-containing protein n=1 Tax=Effusibacillus dendaii TaxID=2743772 RepID=A0A7I8DA38_9BACL|nr:polysaccharide deacetylase family protein [Effusibacillus dendaii]BCJ87038.1 hypothetical protein skT53_20230 [Effusibacillus dendaii]